MKACSVVLLFLCTLPTTIFADTQVPGSKKESLVGVTLRSSEELIAVITVKEDGELVGDIEAKLFLKYAPRTVRNFIKLCEQQFYDGTLFHRIGQESFIQGGDPLSRDKNPKNDGTGGPGYTMPKEANEKTHVRGTLAMAAMGKRSSGSQFFINLKEHEGWNGEYTVFGHVTKGMEIADRIGAEEIEDERPAKDYSMSVRVEKRKRKAKFY